VLERPEFYLNRKQTVQENEDNVPVQDRGWQEALQSLYPLKINEFRIVNGNFTYVEEGSSRPLRLSRLNFRAGNIRNIRSPDRVYPSDLRLDAVVFDSGSVRLDGQANFLAEPHAGVKAEIALEKIALDYFTPLVRRRQFTIREGTLSGTGNVEYAPTIKAVHLQEVTVAGVQVTYRHTAGSAEAEQAAARKTVRAAQRVSNNPELRLRADKINIVKSNFDFVNAEASPDYRLFLADVEFRLRNFTNHLTEGTTVGKLTGKFMGEGEAAVDATFRPEHDGPDFDLAVRIEPTPMRSMNNLWRAYGNFDVTGGLFSFYSELQVKNGALSGYVKPLFKEVDVYDARQDKDKNIFRQLYEGVIGGISWLLENQPRDEVATVVAVSGKLENPQTNTLETITGLIQNAFFKSILPGFLKSTGRPEKDTPTKPGQTMTFTEKTR
jgi:uncharacterized protein DUF748